jgi:disulfide bond formation protein DsbB
MNTAPATSTDIHSYSTAWKLVFGAWLIASSATLGALFFGEVMALPPCLLCWYQRIFMFPLALILPFGLAPFDAKIVRYALPLAIGGWLVAVFHQALVAGLVPKAMEPCARGVPCSKTVITLLDFITIPLLSIAAFSAIIALLVLAHFRSAR